MADTTASVHEEDPSTRDWTVNPETGRSNSSAEFVMLSQVVGDLIKGSARDLLAGNADQVGRLVMAKLAHQFGMRPPSAYQDQPVEATQVAEPTT